jgi:hypothetical protein
VKREAVVMAVTVCAGDDISVNKSAYAQHVHAKLWWRLGLSRGLGMGWVVELVPLEFAGQLIPVARKSGGA